MLSFWMIKLFSSCKSGFEIIYILTHFWYVINWLLHWLIPFIQGYGGCIIILRWCKLLASSWSHLCFGVHVCVKYITNVLSISPMEESIKEMMVQVRAYKYVGLLVIDNFEGIDAPFGILWNYRDWVQSCWLVVFGLNNPLRQYFSLYRVVSQREGDRGEKGQTRAKTPKQPPPAPTAGAVGPCPTLIQTSRMPRHWKFTQDHCTTRPPPEFKEPLPYLHYRLGGSERDVKDIMEHPFFKNINWQDLVEKKVSWTILCACIKVQSPVVQSIVSWTSSLRGQLVKCFMTLLPNTMIFFVEKMGEAFALKLLTFFQQKYWHILDINDWNFNDTLTDDVVSFEPGPGRQL